jgi:hypothetical protein
LELFKALRQIDQLTDESHQLESLVNRAAAASVSPASLLSSICGRPVEDEAVESVVQAAAAHMWAQFLTQSNTSTIKGTAKTPKKKASKSNGVVVRVEFESLSRLLCTLSHPKKTVRSAALSCLDAFIQTIDSWWDACSINGGGDPTPMPTNKNNANVQQMSKDSCLALLMALKEQSTVILTDSESAEWMIQNALNHSHSGISGSKNKKTTPNSRRKSAASKSPAAAENSTTSTIPAASLSLTDQQRSEITQWMLQQMPLQLIHNSSSNKTSADINAAHFLLSCTSEAAQPGELLSAGVGLLNQLLFLNTNVTTSTKPVSLLESQLAVDLVHLYSSEALKELSTNDERNTVVVEETLLNVLSSTATAGSLCACARHAALDRLFDTPLYAALQPERHVSLVMALLQVASRDEDDGCRQRASEVLASIPLPSSVLLPLLAIHEPAHNSYKNSNSNSNNVDINMPPMTSQSPTSVSGKKNASTTSNGGSSSYKKKRSKRNGPSAAGEVVVMSSDKVEEVLAVLELLQWKENVPDSIELVASVQSIALYLLDLLSAEANKQEGGGEDKKYDDGDELNSALPVAGYGLRLATSALDLLAYRHLSTAAAAAQSKKTPKKTATTMAPFNMSLAVRCAQEAPDSSTQTAALSLVSTLALSNPKDALQHVLDIVAVVGGTGTKYDAHSSKIAGATLAAVVPAWLQSKWPVGQLASAVATASKDAPIDRRMSLMQGLADALPDKIGGLVAVIIALLKEASGDDTADDTEKEQGSNSREVAAVLIRKVGLFISYMSEYIPPSPPPPPPIIVCDFRPRIYSSFCTSG